MEVVEVAGVNSIGGDSESVVGCGLPRGVGDQRGSRRFSVVIVIEFSQSTIKVRAVAAIHEVIQGTRKLNTQRAGHGVSSPKPTAIVDC